MESVLKGRWTLQETLRLGEIWSVHVAEDAVSDGEVEVDEIGLKPLDHQDRERLMTLLEISASLSSPFFIPILEWWQEGDHVFIVRKRIPGLRLSELMDSGSPSDPYLTLSVARAVSEASSELYGRGCTYLGISPIRVILSEGMEVYLEGGAHGWLLEDLEPQVYGLIEGFRAPEVERGKEGGRAADVYTLAVLTRELLPSNLLSQRFSCFLESCLDRLPGGRPTSPRLLMEIIVEEMAGMTSRSPREDKNPHKEISGHSSCSALRFDLTERRRRRNHRSETDSTGRFIADIPQELDDFFGVKGPKGRKIIKLLWVLPVLLLVLLLSVMILIPSGGGGGKGKEISMGTEEQLSRVRLPDLVGLSEEKAIEILKDLGLQVIMRDSPSSLWSEGTVCASDPPSGSLLRPGEKVTLSVSKGWMVGEGDVPAVGALSGNVSQCDSSSQRTRQCDEEAVSPTTSPTSGKDAAGDPLSGRAGNSATRSHENKPPVAKMAVSPIGGAAPLVVILDARGSFDPDGKIVRYQWDCGDGTSLSGALIRHVYDSEILPCLFVVTLRVIDDKGLQSEARTVVTVF